MRADLALRSARLQAGTPPARAEVLSALRAWRTNAALAAVREPGRLAKLPEAERQDWQNFWASVEKLRKQASTPK
jgi:hypothetical protein